MPTNEELKTARNENARIVGQPGPHALRNDTSLKVGTEANAPEFTPDAKFEMPDDADQRAIENSDGTWQMYGVPYTHRAQQHLAVQYGKSQQGFDSAPVTFLVHWQYYRAGLMSVDGDSFAQEETRRR